MSALDRLEELERAATPGPWEARTPRPFGGNTPVVVPDDVDSDRWIIDALEPADAELIVTLRNVAPALLRLAREAAAVSEGQSLGWAAAARLGEALRPLEGGGVP